MAWRRLTNFSSTVLYGAAMSMLVDDAQTAALLEKFDLAGRTAQQRPFDGPGNPGIVATIDCTNDADNGLRIEVAIAKHVAQRRLPLSEYEAATIADEFISECLLPDEAALRTMVAHVLYGFSRLFTENEALSHLRCGELQIRRSEYRIDDFQIWADAPLHIKPRLKAHAHDRKAMFGTRSGSQK